MTTMSDNLLTEDEAAARIGWSRSNLRNRRRQHSKGVKDAAPQHRWIPGGRNGGRYYYQREEVDAWLKRHPEIGEKLKRVRDTLSQDEVCEALDLSRSALRARRARLRKKGDEAAAPAHIMAGQEVRYRHVDVFEWAKRVNWTLRPVGGVRIEDMLASENDAIAAGEVERA